MNWTWVDDQTKKEIGLQAKDDGEFWMSYRDFCKQFQEVTICQYGPDFDGDGVVDKFGEEIQLLVSNVSDKKQCFWMKKKKIFCFKVLLMF